MFCFVGGVVKFFECLILMWRLAMFRPRRNAKGRLACPDRGRSSSVAEKIGSEFKTVVFGAPIAPDYLFYNIVFQNLTEADDATAWIKGLKGVANVRLGIMKDLIFVADWIDDQIRKRLPAA